MVNSQNPETLRKRKFRAVQAAQKALSSFITHSISLGCILKIGLDNSSDMQRCLRLGHALLQKNTVEKTLVLLLFDILFRDLGITAMFLEHGSKPLEWLVTKAKEMHPATAKPSPFWTVYAGRHSLQAAHALQVDDALDVAIFFSEHANQNCSLRKVLTKLTQLDRIKRYLSVHISFVFSVLLNIRWTGNVHKLCANTSARVKMIAEILPLARLKQHLIKTKVCEEPQRLTSRDLALICCETAKLLSTVGIMEGPLEKLGVEGLRSCLASGRTKLVLAAMTVAKPIPEEDRQSELCEKHGESAAVDRLPFSMAREEGELPPWHKEVHYCKGAESMAKFLLRSLQDAGYQHDQCL